MKRKFLLFNYFLQKTVQKEQKLLGINDFQTAMLALITSRALIFCRYPSGCSMKTFYASIPKYVTELFLYLCLDIEEKNEGFLKNFNFQKTQPFLGDNGYDIEDMELKAYLERIYSEVLHLTEDEKQLYSQIIGSPWQEINSNFACRPFQIVALKKLELPDNDDRTKLVDQAWNRLCATDEFNDMFIISNKYDYYGRSAPYNHYVKKMNFLLQRI